MNFQGPRDTTSGMIRYQQVVTLLLHIQDSYPDVFKMLIQTPQFEYELDVCRHRKRLARTYLLLLQNFVKQYEAGKEATIHGLRLQQGQLPVLT